MPSALILGCAQSVWSDAEAALRLFTPDAFFAVKDMMVRWPLRIDYAITLHPERTDDFLREYERRWGRKPAFEVWAHRQYQTRTPHKTTPDWAGSSGLLAVKVAIEEGFDKIVLAGVPMDPEGGHISRRTKWWGAQQFRNGWIYRRKDIAPYVRSMSGWTMQVLGEPTREWLQETGSAEASHELIAALQEKAGGQDQVLA